ncbi:MAG: hypothetical protein LBO63_02490, partial [Oscillospiraceae bacterium]|nr:hypothetical protein [Oscillospiraceae bacterium]
KQFDEHGEVKRNAKGKPILVNAYSLLQDHFFEHMREAGFTDFERGERGSTAEHLTVLEYKTKQEQERAAALSAVVEQKFEAAAEIDKAIADKEQATAALDQRTEKKQKRLDKLDEQITVKSKAAATVAEIEAIGKPALLGGFNVTADEIGKLKTLAKKSVKADEKVADMKRRLYTAETERDEVKAQLTAEKKSRPSIKDHLTWFDKFTAAMKRAPKRLMAVIEDILRQPPERTEPQHAAPERKKSHGMEH